MSDETPISLPGSVSEPKVYRAMKRYSKDGFPLLGSESSSELGVRPDIDITIEDDGNVILNEGGMSVVPNWRNLAATRIPKRLRSLHPGAKGPNNTHCYSMGAGPFVKAPVTDSLQLLPDSEPRPPVHGVIAPLQVVPFERFQTDLENTRTEWKIDET